MDAKAKLQRLDRALMNLDARQESISPAGSVTQRCARSWIAIELYDDQENPVADAEYEIEFLSDGKTIRGRLDARGYALERDIDAPPGSACSIKFPGLFFHVHEAVRYIQG